MSGWHNAKIGDFLFEREGKYKPTAKEVYGLSRISKIDMSGRIHVSEKPSNTNMILIKPGDLVISGIGVAMGSLGVYQGDRDIVATIHYSSYTFDKGIIDIEFLKRFIKSPEFVRLLKQQVRGGMRPEIKAKHLLPLTINLPSLGEQKKIADHCRRAEKGAYELSDQISNQRELLAGLRRRILQDAIEGKLTADWRKGASRNYESAEVLLKRISQEKERLIKAGEIAKQKPLPSVADGEKPFALPQGWAWCRLKEIGYTQTGATPPTANKENYGNYIPFVQPANIDTAGNLTYGNRGLSKKGILTAGRLIKSNSVLMTCIAGIGKSAICSVDIACNQQINAITPLCDVQSKYIQSIFQSIYFQFTIKQKATGGIMPILNKGKWESIAIPLPPLAEQRAIVAKVEKLLALCDSLQAEARNNEALAKRLMQAALKEAFTPPKN